VAVQETSNVNNK